MSSSFDSLLERAVLYWHKQFENNRIDYVLVLVNPFSADPLVDQFEEEPCFKTRFPLKVDPRWLLGHPAPYLVKIDQLTTKENLFNQTLSEALAERLHPPAGQPPTRAWCAWLPCSNEANHPIAHQASALGRYACSVYTPSGPKGFRFYDPRIAPHLPAILTPAQFGAVFRGIAEHWHYMDEAGQFGQLPAAAPPDTETTATPVYLQFNAQQNQSLTIIGQVNYILQLIPGWDIVAPEKHHDIMQIVQRCHGWGINDDSGVSIFVHCALTKHRLFDTHPDVVKVLSQQKAAFLDWCAACQDEDWLTIIEQLNSKTHETYGNKR